jgi:hypothetical protein
MNNTIVSAFFPADRSAKDSRTERASFLSLNFTTPLDRLTGLTTAAAPESATPLTVSLTGKTAPARSLVPTNPEEEESLTGGAITGARTSVSDPIPVVTPDTVSPAPRDVDPPDPFPPFVGADTPDPVPPVADPLRAATAGTAIESAFNPFALSADGSSIA